MAELALTPANDDVPEDELELAEALADLLGDDPEHLEECEICSTETGKVADELVDHFATDVEDNDELN